MQPPSLYSAVSGALLFAHNVLAVNNNHGLGLVPTAGGFHRQDALSLSPINTEGDKELEEWLQAHMRMSPSALRACPELCSKTVNGRDGSGYFLLPDLARLAKCNETMLLDIAVKSNDKAAIRACTADYGNDVQSMYQLVNGKAAPCPTPNNKIITTKVQVSTGFPSEVYPGGDDSDPRFSANHVLSVARQISRHLARQRPSCARSAMQFGYSQSAAIGVFSGAELHQQGLMADVLSRFIESVEAKPISKTTVFQLCYQDTLGADYTLGIVVTSAANLHKAKDVIRLWASGKCFVSSGQQDWMETRVRIPPTAKAATTKSTTNSATAVSKLNSGLSRHHYGARAVSILLGRGECRTVTVPAGSGCLDVAQKCGISQDDLNKYNSQADFCKALVAGQKVCCTSGTLPSSIRPANGDGTCVTKEVKGGDSCGSMASKCDLDPNDFMKVNTKDNLCSNLVEGQQVCCSSGKLPDRRPKPEADGTCASYKTANGDSCASIAASRDLTVQDLEDFNKKTWGWNGCDAIWRDYRLCVSKGDPPMPESVPNAVCGPTVKGTTKPGKDTDLSTLNPCPLKACCNVWGQCGLTDDFCTASKSKTGAPGTSALRNGCVSNCGRELVKGPPPASKINVAYFEAWNHNRPCLRMDVTDIDTSKYSHIHFAFGEITRDFKVDISKVQEQFDLFKTMTGVKKIISFGGWDFSASPGTFHILREAVKPENRDTLKNNVVAFINEHKLDGVDLDWEYPGAADFPDIPTDDPHNGINYHNFLKILKSGLGTDKSVSFAAPSSYWYLRSYPVEAMARTLDYIVFMTYDLHGQWDYNSKWSSPGCDTGNCLRSHINDTETKDSLIMITKAGVPSNKVVVGVASYGRTFKMEAAGCDGPQCKFTGSPRVSNAAKGRCTDTAGYISNAEIAEIIASGKVNRQWKEAGSNLLVYNDTEWVSYMNDDTKAERARFYDSYNFAGTTDWAVDLQEFTE
ncbi:hypothetical protein QQS21_001643 [Conoideocrella luteorostrata]|uniref:chitinase n=1 Tax=Conoideocrella luteorostrata TaxID=1105319 RepID=A0AAJ0CZB1_9HYPO|nr:hypothetical protein QQS21_001643 [Conoideocrella luteorostrata]